MPTPPLPFAWLPASEYKKNAKRESWTTIPSSPLRDALLPSITAVP